MAFFLLGAGVALLSVLLGFAMGCLTGRSSEYNPTRFRGDSDGFEEVMK